MVKSGSGRICFINPAKSGSGRISQKQIRYSPSLHYSMINNVMYAVKKTPYE